FIFTENEGESIRQGNLHGQGSSHAFENSMVSIVGCLAMWDTLPVARRGLEYYLHYFSGVTTSFGSVEAHNEGLGYGFGKSRFMMDALWAFRTTLPHLHFEKLPIPAGISDWANRIAPVGMKYGSWGNRGFWEYDWLNSRYGINLSLAYLTGNRQAMGNAVSSAKRLRDIGRIEVAPRYGDREAKSIVQLKPSVYHPWIGYVLPYYGSAPELVFEQKTAAVWPVAGWVAASSRPPSDYSEWRDNTGITFVARPHGRYSHSFGSDNSFDLYGYGEVLAHGGGGTTNRDRFANSSMSHNTVLINGRGQESDQGEAQFSARLAAYQDADHYVYMAGDASVAYGDAGLRRFIRHVLFVRGRYFVVYDDLAASKPSTWQWLYHLNAEAGFQILEPAGFHLEPGDAGIAVHHIAHTERLKIDNRAGDRGRRNPVINEAYPMAVAKTLHPRISDDMLYANHIWVTTSEPTTEHQFLAVLYPHRKGEKPGKVRRISDHALAVTTPDGKTDLIAFGEPVPGTTMVVDVAAIRSGAAKAHGPLRGE
ncbi:MAG: hypothetical protein GY953_05995, partial [bacterium]|nr:hypothetical protein [bacterium]